MSFSMPVSESFLLTAFGIITGFIGATLTFCLKSRCSEIKCCCVYCKRDVVPASEINNIRDVIIEPMPIRSVRPGEAAPSVLGSSSEV